MLLNKTHLKRTIVLALPIVIGQIGQLMLGVADNIMIGQVGAIPLAAASLSNALFNQLMVFGLGVTFALSPLVAASWEAGAEDDVRALQENSMLINLVLAALLMALIFFLKNILPHLDQDPAVVVLADPYLTILAFSLIPFLVFQTQRQFCDGLSYTRAAMYIMILANLVNIFFNWLLIYGNWGFPQMELNGAGVSTLLTRIFAAAAMMAYVRYSGRLRKFNIRFIGFSWHKQTASRLLKIGIPTGSQYFFEVGAFSGVAIIVGWLGAEALAAHQIALNLASISFMFAFGISSAAAIRVGSESGKGRNGDIRGAGFNAIYIGGAIMLINGLIFIFLRYELVGLYIDNRQVQELAAMLLIIAAMFQVFDGVQAVAVGVLRGLGDVKVPTLLNFIAYWLLSIPIGYFFAFGLGLGLSGVWYGFVTGLGSAAIMLTMRFHLKSKAGTP